MADISLIVNYETVKQANRAILGIGTAAEKSGSVFERAFKKIEASQRKALTDVNKQLAFSKRMEAQKAREAAVTQKAAQAVAKEEERLKNKFVEGYTAMNVYSRELNDLAVARKKGIITTQQQEEAVERLNLALASGTGAFSQFGAAAGVGGRRMSSTGMAMQQTGYQVGDFLVQVQGGTNAMVAFGQQATQLVGILPMFNSFMGLSGTSLIALSAGLGIAIPLLTAIGAAFMRTRANAKEAAGDVDTFEDRLKSAREEVRGMKQDLDLMRSGFKDMFELTLTDQVKEAEKKLEDARAALQADVAVLESRGVDRGSEAYQETLDYLSRGEVSATKLVEMAEKELALARELQSELAKKEATEEAITRGMEDRQAMLEAEKALLEERNSVVKSIVEGRDAEVKRLSDEIALNQAILEFGRESAQVAELKAEQAREAFIAEKRSEGQLGNNLRLLLAKYDASVKLTNELGASEDKALGLADALKEAAAAMASLSSFGAGLDKALAVSIAKVQALKTGADAAVASSIAAMRFDSKAKTGAAISAAASSGDPLAVITARAEGAIQQATIDQIEANQLAASGIKSSGRGGGSRKSGGGGGGKSSVDEAAEAIEKLREQLTLQEALLGKTEAQRQVIQALGVDYEKIYGAKATGAIIARIEALKAEEEQIANIQSVADTMKSSMSDAFMSMVEGTKSFKDAMKDMARAVIKQLFDILVVQQLVGSFDAQTKQGTGLAGALMGGLSGLFGGVTAAEANGGVWSKGVKMFANGGVVGSPTMFSHSGGLGVMGEAGPEAIMPLKRGANGKLGVQAEGSGGSIVVNQSFNFSANGDESVKKLIAQAAPQIAKMTQQGLMDQRRRGGVVKSTFS